MIMATLMALTSTGQAQSLLDPLVVAEAEFADVTLTDGTRVLGTPTLKDIGMATIKKLKVKPRQGKTVKLLPFDVKEMYIEPTAEALLQSAAESQDSITESMRTNEDEMLDRDRVYYLPIVLPNGKPALSQLLNPTFAGVFEIFPDPKGKETGGIPGVKVGGQKITGGVLKTYLVRRAGTQQTVLLKKGKYDKEFGEFYKDCVGMDAPEKIKWKEFAAHIAACRTADMIEAEAPAMDEAKPMEDEATTEEDGPMAIGVEGEGEGEEQSDN